MTLKRPDSEDILIDGLINSDIQSFEYIYQKYSRELFYISMAYVNNTQDSEDIIQEAFIYLWKNRSNLSRNSNLGAYLRVITKNISLNYIRNKKIKDKHHKIIAVESGNNEREEKKNYVEFSKECDRKISYINQRINDLPNGCKKIFLMSVIEGSSYKEVSRSLGISINTVKTQIKIAYTRIRNRQQ
jgi:RNA polymerase sigma-70 factor (ECF subfamily)